MTTNERLSEAKGNIALALSVLAVVLATAVSSTHTPTVNNLHCTQPDCGKVQVLLQKPEMQRHE